MVTLCYNGETITKIERKVAKWLAAGATPGACPVDVKVMWDGKEVSDALVAARGHTGGSVETLQGRARLRVYVDEGYLGSLASEGLNDGGADA